MTTNWRRPGTALAAAAWAAICTYLYFAWPSLAALFETLAPPGAAPLLRVPRAAFAAFGVVAVLGLILKDRWLPASRALVVDVVVGAPAFWMLAALLQPFFLPID